MCFSGCTLTIPCSHTIAHAPAACARAEIIHSAQPGIIRWSAGSGRNSTCALPAFAWRGKRPLGCGTPTAGTPSAPSTVVPLWLAEPREGDESVLLLVAEVAARARACMLSRLRLMPACFSASSTCLPCSTTMLSTAGHSIRNCSPAPAKPASAQQTLDPPKHRSGALGRLEQSKDALTAAA